MINMDELVRKLRKCRECSCSRCSKNGTLDCYIEIAIRELNRYEQAMDALNFEKYMDNK